VSRKIALDSKVGKEMAVEKGKAQKPELTAAEMLRRMPESTFAEEFRKPAADQQYPYNEMLAEAKRRGVTPGGVTTPVAETALQKTGGARVVRDVRDDDGKPLGRITVPYDGTPEGAVKAAREATRQMDEQYPEASNIQSRIGATDKGGAPKWAISPNFKHVAELGTGEADYIFGDVKAARAGEKLEEGSLAKQISAIRDRYEDSTDTTSSEVIDQIEAAAQDSDDPSAAKVLAAVETYRDEEQENRDLKGRGDMDEAEEKFFKAVEAATQTEEAKHHSAFQARDVGKFDGPAEGYTPKAEQEGETHQFSSTQVNLPKEVAGKVLALGKKIPDGELAEDGREETPHITVKYGLHDQEPEAVQKILADEGPITVTLGKTSVFPAKKVKAGGGPADDVLKIDVEGPELERLNKKISDALPHTDTFPDYKPHVTVAYLKPGEGKKYAGDDSLEGTKITLGAVTFSNKAHEQTEIPLEGKGKEADSKRVQLKTEGATLRLGKETGPAAFRNDFDIIAKGAHVSGQVRDVDFPGEKFVATRGEIFRADTGGDERKGLGTSLVRDALNLLRANGSTTVNMNGTTAAGRASTRTTRTT